MSTQDSTTNSTSGTSQAAEQNASFQQCSMKSVLVNKRTKLTVVYITSKTVEKKCKV